jgi:hypothetical protein
VKLYKKPKSKFYWYDFTIRGRRYRASTQETKSVRALKIASLSWLQKLKTPIHFHASPSLSLISLSGFWVGWTLPGWKR